MPKDCFHISQTTDLAALKPGDRIHVIGVAGVAMAQLALALAERGYLVSGSDKEFYEPMGGLLRRSAVRLLSGYQGDHLAQDVSLVIIGNTASYENPEVLEVERRNLPYTLFPKVLSELVIAGRHSIVAAGTHGKSTTSAIGAFVLQTLGLDPSYFVGGVVPDLAQSLHIGGAQFSVVEGDEYDSAFFAKLPKFHFYRPTTLVITSLEFDHADLYRDVEAIEAEFDKLVGSMDCGTVICCTDGARLKRCAERWSGSVKPEIRSYGTNAGAQYRLVRREPRGSRQLLSITLPDGRALSADLGIPGEHNALNALAVVAACTEAGLEPQSVADALREFKGVKRRQEIRLDRPDLTLIEDFAHHPTAVRETIRAIAESYPDRRIVAVFEPRSTTSQRSVFQKQYIEAFAEAGYVVIAKVKQRDSELGQAVLDIDILAEEINKLGIHCAALPDADAIVEHLLRERKERDVFLVMSNGSFGGVIEKVIEGVGS